MAEWKRMDRELPEMKEVCTVHDGGEGIAYTFPASRPVRVKIVEVIELTGSFFYEEGKLRFEVTDGPEEMIGEMDTARDLSKITEWTYDN